MGAEKIYFYELQVHPNISKVLRYYERMGKVQLTPLTLPGGQPNVAGFQHLYLTKKLIINDKMRLFHIMIVYIKIYIYMII